MTTTPAHSEDLAIEARDLVKTFGATRALDGFDLTVPTGEVTGFLGPNGAGKSTAIRVFLGMLRADSGTARVLGQDAWTDQVDIHRRLAYVPGDTSLWPNLTGGEALDILAGLGGAGSGRHSATARGRTRREELLERFELDPTKKARTYSKGNRQKVSLVAALASDAELFVFDEPTSGLDPLMEAVFQQEVRALRDSGKTVLLSSHILAEVEKLCDRVTIIRAGRTVESGTLAEMRHLTRSTVTATLAQGQTHDDGPSASADPSRWSGLEGVHDLAVDGLRLRFDVDHQHLSPVLGRLATSGVENVTIAPPSLEDLFLRHYGDRVESA